VNMQQFQETLQAIRKAGTPLVAIRTADPASAMEHVMVSLNGKADKTPILSFDYMNGLKPVNSAGVQALAAAGAKEPPLAPEDALLVAAALPEGTIWFFHNPQRLFDNRVVIQGIWNLRDLYKTDSRAVYLLCTRGAELPAELQSDVIILDQPLPSVGDLEKIAEDVIEANGLRALSHEETTRVSDALIGLAGFPAEQVFSMSASKQGINHARLWERKRQAISQVHGLSPMTNDMKFSDIGGCETVKQFIDRVMKGRRKFRVVVRIDELEKQVSGSGPKDGGSSKTGLIGTWLTFMQERKQRGAIFLGHPGAAKTAIADAIAPTYDIFGLTLDLGAVENQYVGASGERLRACLSVIDAISDGEAYWIGTCNNIDALTPEMRRRFKHGIFFFDLPSREERLSIWKIYIEKLGLQDDALMTSPYGFQSSIADEGWTGAEIRECCEKAWEFDIPLAESAKYIVPVSVSSKTDIESLRQSATGKYLSASYPGRYSANQIEANKPVAKRRIGA
jgi:hypothetical protein